MNESEKPTHLDLFSGIGGFSLAFEAEGFKTIGFSEIDPFASSVLKKHWPEVPNYGDVRNLEKFSDRIGRPDVITAGDPCQENSSARQAVDTTSPSLGHEFIRAVAIFCPRFVVRENPAAVRPDAPWPWWRVRAELERLGYIVLPIRLRACCFGFEHQRERLLLLGELSNSVRQGLERPKREIMERAAGLEGTVNASRQNRRSSTSRICRAIDGVPNRSHRLRCLGNAVVPKIAQIFARAIYNSMTDSA
jgi:DNA (cytosine-5)-methyltransferase 1